MNQPRTTGPGTMATDQQLHQLHEDLRQLRAVVEAGTARMGDIQSEVAGLKGGLKLVVIEALTEHALKVSSRIDDIEHRLKVIEDDRLRRDGMTQLGKIGLAAIQLPGVGAALYLIAVKLGIVHP